MKRWMFVAGVLFPAPAWAISCTVDASTPLSFGSYSVFSATPTDTSGGPTINCTAVGAFDTVTVELSAGLNGTFASRKMASGGDELAYNVYLNAGHTTVWGDGTSGTSVYGPFTPGNGVDEAIACYGRIPALQDVPVGTYTDVLVVTVVF